METRLSRTALGACLALALIALGNAPASAGHFSKLSSLHTAQGVSQYNYAGIILSQSFPIRLTNPVHVTQLAAVLMYESERNPGGTPDGTPGLFLGCLVVKLKAHGSLGLSGSDLDTAAGSPLSEANQAEVIWAPKSRVSVGSGKTRLADGLGGNIETAPSEGEIKVLGHPGAFSLPRDGVVTGQKQAAIDCVCAGQTGLGENPNKFTDFGIACP